MARSVIVFNCFQCQNHHHCLAKDHQECGSLVWSQFLLNFLEFQNNELKFSAAYNVCDSMNYCFWGGVYMLLIVKISTTFPGCRHWSEILEQLQSVLSIFFRRGSMMHSATAARSILFKFMSSRFYTSIINVTCRSIIMCTYVHQILLYNFEHCEVGLFAQFFAQENCM